MGLFGKLMRKNRSEDDKIRDYSYLLEIAGLISHNDGSAMKKLGVCIEDPSGYFKACSDRYDERGIDINKCDPDTLYWIALVDELEETGYVVSADWKDDPEQVLWALESIKTFDELVGSVLSDMDAEDDADVESFVAEINALLEKVCVCWIDIDSDCYELAIVTVEAFERISEIARENGHSIVKF